MTNELFSRLKVAMNVDDMFDTQADMVFDNMANVTGMPAGMVTCMKTAFFEVFTSDTFDNVIQTELTRCFSTKELETIAEFFEGGVGRRWAEESGAAMLRINEQIQKIVQQRMPLVQKIFEKQLAALPDDERME